MTWREQAAEIIRQAALEIPADASLTDRKRIVDAARPYWGGCSWPRKAWQAARRDYLVRFGYEPRTKAEAERRASAVADLPLFTTPGKET